MDVCLEQRLKREASVTFEELFKRFIASKANRSLPYRTSLRYTPSRFPSLSDRLVTEIESEEIEQILLEMTESVRNAFVRILRAAFNFGIRRGWCERNAVNGIEVVALRYRKAILTNAEVKMLLSTAVDKDTELLPYVLLCVFAGIRPKRWSD